MSGNIEPKNTVLPEKRIEVPFLWIEKPVDRIY